MGAEWWSSEHGNITCHVVLCNPNAKTVGSSVGCSTLRFLETESVEVATRSLSEEDSDDAEESESSELES